MTTFILISFAVVLAIVLGSMLGRLSWWAWHDRESPGILGFILFPWSFRAGKFGTNKDPFVGDGDWSRSEYLMLMAGCAVVKVLWTIAALIIFAGEALIRLLVFGPKNVMEICRYAPAPGEKPPTAEELEALDEPEGAAEAVDLPDDVKIVLEHRAKQEQKALLEARIAEIESTPDFDKMQALHVRN